MLVAGREKRKLVARGRSVGSRSVEVRLLRVEGRREGEAEFGSVGWPNTKPLAAAAIAVPVPTRLGTACMIARDSQLRRERRQRLAFLGEGDGGSGYGRVAHRQAMEG